MLTPEQKHEYLSNRPGHCPYCGSEDIEGRGYDYDSDPGQIIDCNECERCWMDVFTLTDVLEMNDQGEIVGEATTAKQPLGNFGDFFQEVMSDLVSHHGWDDPYGTITPQYNPDGSLLDLIHRHYHLGSDSGFVASEINRVWCGASEDEGESA